MSEAVGRRERNKQDKLGRLKQAARELFAERGYDHATTRDIASRAGIGMGTLFAYARDKRDLLFLIFNDELEALATTGFANVPHDLPLADQLTEFFVPFFRFFGAQPDLARFMLRELEFFESGPQAQRFRAARDVLLFHLARQFRAWQAEGRLRGTGTAEDAARASLAIYAGIVRDALGAPAPDMARGIETLRRLLALLLTGLAPRA